MSIKTPPVQRIFDLQRKYIEQSVENIKKSLDTHKKTINKDTVEPQIEVYDRSVEAGKTLSDSYFDALKEILPDKMNTEQQKELYNKAYETFQEGNKQATKASKENLENVVETYLNTLNENIETLDQQINLVVEGIDELENQTVKSVEKTKEVIEVEEK